MAEDRSIVNVLALKLGLSSSDVLRKANEYLRLLQLRTTSGTQAFDITESCRAVICLDLAAAATGKVCEKDEVIRLSGVKKRVYANHFHTVNTLLGLDKQLSVKDLCVQFGCTELCALTEKLLQKYIDSRSNTVQPPDMNHPMYCAVAVYSACKHRKVKVDRAKLLEMSRLKRSEFDKLASGFITLLQSIDSNDKKRAKKRTHDFVDVCEKLADEYEKKAEEENKQGNESHSSEDYAEWKKRILAESCATAD